MVILPIEFNQKVVYNKINPTKGYSRPPRGGCGRNDDNSGMWQIEAMENIRNYFRERFADNEQVIIL